jgi:acetyl esterase/lipase
MRRLGREIPSRVILYLHGGGFHLPMFEDSASFWYHVQKELKDSYGLDVGVAILDYSKPNHIYEFFLPGLNVPAALIPEANFPVPLLQTVTAIKHLFSRGIQPSNLILMGDSAGANLAIQVLLHIIHPLADLPTLFESPMEDSKFAGAYLMSPWLTLLPRENSSKKCLPRECDVGCHPT